MPLRWQLAMSVVKVVLTAAPSSLPTNSQFFSLRDVVRQGEAAIAEEAAQGGLLIERVRDRRTQGRAVEHGGIVMAAEGEVAIDQGGGLFGSHALPLAPWLVGEAALEQKEQPQVSRNAFASSGSLATALKK